MISKIPPISILYTPLENEVDYTVSDFPLTLSSNIFIAPTDKKSDPFLFAEKCKKQFINTIVSILIPGRKFDVVGTRYGNGGGWYDRFLSCIPQTWIRIGITDKLYVSSTPLTRQPWDEVMDWIVIHDDRFWDLYETHARKK